MESKKRWREFRFPTVACFTRIKLPQFDSRINAAVPGPHMKLTIVLYNYILLTFYPTWLKSSGKSEVGACAAFSD